jgi:CTP:molybdopterin cytidylyltransferase MocA
MPKASPSPPRSAPREPLNRVVGILLAAGAGRRAGGPKALRSDADGSGWLSRGVRVLLGGGCAEVVVVLGAQAATARNLLAGLLAAAAPVTVVEATDWSEGMAASLRAGLAAAGECDGVLVHLVDLPDVTADVVRRVLDSSPDVSAALARACYAGRPGHPVLIGSAHRGPVVASLRGEAGARDYLAAHAAYCVECGDLATGVDRDLGSAD